MADPEGTMAELEPRPSGQDVEAFLSGPADVGVPAGLVRRSVEHAVRSR